MKVRRATLEDAAGIAAVHVASSQRAYDGLIPAGFARPFTVERRREQWRSMLLARECEVWVAEEDERVLGWISVGPSRDPDADPTAGELWAMYVDPDAWRRGVGRALWTEGEAHLRRAGFARVTLWMLARNARAMGFYRSMGFVEDPGHRKTLDKGGVTVVEVRLCRDLRS